MKFTKFEMGLIACILLVGIAAGQIAGFRALAIIAAPLLGIVYFFKAKEFFPVVEKPLPKYAMAYFYYVMTAFALLRAGSVLSHDLVEAFSLVGLVFMVLLIGYVLFLRTRATDTSTRNSLDYLFLKIFIAAGLPAFFSYKFIPEM